MKKGFTLIELLAVIIILALLVILVFPSIINYVRDSSKKTDELTLKLIYDAADTYIAKNKNDFSKNNGNEFSIDLKTLVDDGFLSSPVRLSGNDSDITDKKCIQVSYNNGFTYQLKDIGDCNEFVINVRLLNVLVK